MSIGIIETYKSHSTYNEDTESSSCNVHPLYGIELFGAFNGQYWEHFSI